MVEIPELEALRTELQQHHVSSYSWTLYCCRGDTLQAEEVLQATYLKILERQARYRGDSAFRTWLFGVIRRTAAEHRRRERLYRLRFAGNIAVPEPVDPSIDHEDQTHRARLFRRFRQVLPALPRRQREVMQLIFGHDLTIQEAATVLGVSLGSARRHYERGKQRLRELLADWG